MEEAGMVRLLACLIIFSLAPPTLRGSIARDQNWGDYQTAGSHKKSDMPKSRFKVKELKSKSAPLDLQKEKIREMKDER